MATYHYKAMNAQGSFSEGQVDAIDTRTAAYRLQGMGLIPVSAGHNKPVATPKQRACRPNLLGSDIRSQTISLLPNYICASARLRHHRDP